MTDVTTPVDVEGLRSNFMLVQKAKRDGPLVMQPVWDIINAVPAILAALDGMPEFERDAEAERLNDLVEAQATTIKQLEQALRAVKACEKTALPGRFVNLAHLRKAMLLVDAALATPSLLEAQE